MGWLGSWENRRKITISNADVDAILSDFPILVKISASSGTSYADITDIFTELTADANRKKIAVTTSDGTTECYVEIERWDHANSVAWLWVKVPSVAAASATELYIYYDVGEADNTTYVGDTTDAVTHNVWDSNFKAVYHMAQDPNGDVADAIKDSTSNQNDGTPVGTMLTADLVDGKIGKAIDFDGTDDYINCGSDASFDDIAAKTIETSIRLASFGTSPYSRVIQKSNVNSDGWCFYVQGGVGLNQLIFAQSWNSGDFCSWGTDTDTLAITTWYSAAITYNKGATANDPLIYIDGASKNVTEGIAPSGACDSDASNDLWIGARSNSGSDREYDGIMDEVRISDIVRSAAWIKATHYSNWDILVAFSAAETTLFCDNVECSTEVTSPSLALVPGTLNDVPCETQVTAPTLEVVAKDINASDVSCLTQVTSPSLDKIKTINPSNVESSSEITTVSTAFPCAIDATLPMMTADFLGGGGGLIDATLPAMTADILGGGTIIAATLPVMTAAIVGKVGIVCEVEAVLPTMTASVTGITNVLAEIDATLPAMTALVVGVTGDSAVIATTLPMVTAELDGYHDITGDIDAELPMMSAYIVGTPDRFASCDVLRFSEPEL